MVTINNTPGTMNVKNSLGFNIVFMNIVTPKDKNTYKEKIRICLYMEKSKNMLYYLPTLFKWLAIFATIFFIKICTSQEVNILIISLANN